MGNGDGNREIRGCTGEIWCGRSKRELDYVVLSGMLISMNS